VRKEAVTKTRVVFDASCKDSNGISLNDALFKGPTLLSELFSVIMKFRCFKYVISADIKKMYRQTLIDREQTSLQTILWREDLEAPIEMFELLTVTYGTKPASYLAVKCLRELAISEKIRFLKAAEAIHDFYMDDLLSSSDTVADLLELKTQLVKLMECDGFELHK
jgi:hypothetical protein